MSVERFIQPGSLKELREVLSVMTPGSKVVSGGTDLMIEIEKKGLQIPVLVSLCRVPELYGIKMTETDQNEVILEIGAMTCHADIAASPLVRENASALADACDHVGSRQIRNRGTIGGSLGNASVAGDMLPVLVLLHADLCIVGPGGKGRTLPAEQLQTGVGKTCLDPQEVIASVCIPVRPGRKSCFVKLGAREEVTIAEISLCFSWEKTGGAIRDVEGVLGAVDVRPIRLPEADEILGQGHMDETACERLTESLRERIREIRLRRKRPPRLRIREGEKEYKERAVKGIVHDAVSKMKIS